MRTGGDAGTGPLRSCGDAAEPLQSRSSGPTDEKRNHMAGFSITIAGDSALNLEFAHAISPETSAMIRLAAENLTADPIEGITELVPTFCSLMVYTTPWWVAFDEAVRAPARELRDVGEADLSVRKIVPGYPCATAASTVPTWPTWPRMPGSPRRRS